MGGILLFYIAAILPLWFRNPNPVIFVPCSFVAAGAYILYIDLSIQGGWFLSFAFPVVGFLGGACNGGGGTAALSPPRSGL